MSDSILFVRVAPAEKAEIARAARSADLSISDLTRKSVLAAADAILEVSD